MKLTSKLSPVFNSLVFPSLLVSIVFGHPFQPPHWETTRASLETQRLKRLPAMWETQVWTLGWEDPLEKEMATHSSILAWRIPWTEEPGGLPSTGLQRVGHDWATSLHFNLLEPQCYYFQSTVLLTLFLSFTFPFTNFFISVLFKYIFVLPLLFSFFLYVYIHRPSW